MNDHEFDRAARAWLDDGPTRMSDRALLSALDEIHTTRQRRARWQAWRTNHMHTYARMIAAAAALLVVAIGGYQLLPRGPGSGGTSATLSPRLPLLARGEFRLGSEGIVSLRAVADGSSVTGRLWVGNERGEVLDAALQCTLTTEDGLIMIGGFTEGDTLAAIALRRGSPVQATIWTGSATSSAASCLASLDEQLLEHVGTAGLEPIEGFVELGTNAAPPPGSALLARGNFVTVRGAVDLEASGRGSGVSGRMTVSQYGGWFTVDLQCGRTTEDGLIMIGGYTIDADETGSGLSPQGTVAAIVLKRGSPVLATVWSQRGGGQSGAASCMAYFDERIAERLMDSRLDNDDPNPIEGTVELGP